MDALSAILAPVHLEQTAWISTVARGPWGVALTGGKTCVRFHYLLRGNAWLTVEGLDEPRIALAGGDLAVLPLGHAHTLRDHPRTGTVRFDDLVRCGTRPGSSVVHVTTGGGGPETTVITGVFALEDPLARRILQALPPLIRMIPDAERAVPSFLQNIQFITREVEQDRPGSEIVLLRMAEVVFIQILRAYLSRFPDDASGGGFLGALRDPHTAAALGAMHRRPEAPWTVASLAEEVGLSRSVFAARFTRFVGEPPLGYLTDLRMHKASTLLHEGASLAKASKLSGYASEASFSHAFRQWAGVAPGAWRRTMPDGLRAGRGATARKPAPRKGTALRSFAAAVRGTLREEGWGMPTPSQVTKPAVSVPANNPMIGLESMTDAQKHVHDILNDLTTVMMITYDDAGQSGVRGTTAPRSGLHARPMSVARLDPDGTLWFVTAIDSPKVGEAESPPIGHVCGQTSTRYLSLSGTFSVTRDRAALERVWSKANDIWFPEGVNDPRACLLGFHPSEAEFWDMSGAKGLSFVFEAAKALVTGKAIENQDDPQRHGKVQMA